MREILRKYNDIFKRLMAVMLIVILTVTGIDFRSVLKVDAAAKKVTLYFVDNSAEKWVGNDYAVLELVDNTNGHDHYSMTKVNDTTWSASVPESAYNITFNRYNSDKTTQWNSWSAGGRDSKNAYYADGSEYGHWENMEESENHFHVGDTIYLDISEYTKWENDSACMYVNFTDATKEENSGKDIQISTADTTKYNPKSVKETEEQYVYECYYSQLILEKTVRRRACT